MTDDSAPQRFPVDPAEMIAAIGQQAQRLPLPSWPVFGLVDSRSANWLFGAAESPNKADVAIGDSAGTSGHHLELVEYLTPSGERGDVGIANPGAAHLAFAVDDLDAEHARLSSAGVRFFSTPNEITEGVNAGGKAVYFHGPDDIVHELVQPPRHVLTGR